MSIHLGKVKAVISCIVLVSLLLPLCNPFVDLALAMRPAASPATIAPLDTGPFRAIVTYPDSLGRERLDKLGVVVLREASSDSSAQTAIVLVDTAQLADLARLGFKPRAAEDLGQLVKAHTDVYPWLEESVQPVLKQAAVVRDLSAAGAARFSLETATEEMAAAQANLHTEMQSLSVEQQTALASLATVDDDGDGLSNTEESWWCTDATNPDSDGDGVSDGAEVQAARDWLRNQRSTPPASGKPFAGWPAQITGCMDSDMDSVPDLAETWDLGLNPNRESTDRDKFDDGQELFGNTYCPGDGGFCGYGALPRNEDWGVIFAEMPAWVEAPGNHPFVAAFPVPEVDVVESSLHVETVTVVTTDHTISQGEERSYSTAKTEGTSTSVADTVTWNEWQEMSESISQSALSLKEMSFSQANILLGIDDDNPNDGPLKRFDRFVANEVKYIVADTVAGFGCLDGKLSVDFKPAGIGIGGEVGSSSLYTDNNCRRAMGAAEKIYPGYIVPDDQQTTYQSVNVRLDNRTDVNVQNQVLLNNSCDVNNDVGGYEGMQYVHQSSGQTVAQRFYQISNFVSAPTHTTTNSQGKSWGGSQTTTHSQYEEHTVTNGEAFSSGESWGTAVATDTAHAADLWFTYQIRNAGMEYAREIGDLAFNVYIGDDPNPAVTYFVAPDLGGDGKFHNFMPGEAHEYTSRRIPLSLEQMRAIDLGGPVRVVLEDYTYGIDELFYEDAINAGVLLAIDDDMADGDEAIDFYLIPTWGEESVMDVLTRYFPHEVDEDGNLISVSTPEFGNGYYAMYANTTGAESPGDKSLGYVTAPDKSGFNAMVSSPIDGAQFSSTGIDARADARANTALAQTTTVTWREHSLSLLEWWNVYMDDLGDGTAGFQDTPAAPGGMAFFRFNKDSDLDGYSDRSEIKLGTDPEDAASHPNPEPAGGIHNVRVGDYVTSTLLLLNTGIYDAYGVEAVMVAPDDSITIENNTVGGSGRVRALQGVVVGSRVLPPDYTDTMWRGDAQPFSAGYYTGDMDREYTFTALDTGSVGDGTLRFTWDDGHDITGTLDFGTGYASPTPVEAGYGVQIGLVSGQVQSGDTFVVSARTPRDTFQYTVNREPYTPPLVIVSYNDPQGNHRFVLPPETLDLSDPVADLLPYSGHMLQDIGVEIVTTEAFAPGANTTDLVVNNPSEVTLQDAHLFLEFINISGTVASEVPVTVTLEPGPNVVPVMWDTATFSPTFAADEDYIVMAFWTDYQGNILDTAGRPLSSFQEDPKPVAVLPTATWDFGTATQGQVLHHTLDIANTGFMDLRTYVSASAEIDVRDGHRILRPGDMESYDLTLDTAGLPVGPYNTPLTLRTGDPTNPGSTVLVQGEIVAGTPAVQLVKDRPLDMDVAIPGMHGQGEWVTFTHTLGSGPQTLHPVKVYSQDYATLWGVGKYATDFSAGAVSYGIFGDGHDGDLTVAPGHVIYGNPIRERLTATALSNQPLISVDYAAKFTVGEELLIIQMQGTGVGNYEFGIISEIQGNNIVLSTSLEHTYTVGGNSKAQVIRVPHYRNVTVQVGGTLTSDPWDGNSGGILVMRINGELLVQGEMSVSGKGYAGGVTGVWVEHSWSYPGGGYVGGSTIRQQSANGNGGGGGAHKSGRSGGGGGGGHTTAGADGYASSEGEDNGYGGTSAGTVDFSTIVLGGGGGGGGHSNEDNNGGNGGNGGGIALIYSKNIHNTGAIISNGNRGYDAWGSNPVGDGGGGGGGAGGAILLVADTVDIGSAGLQALAGAGGTSTGYGADGGTGSMGRIRIEYCDTLIGSSIPIASEEMIECYVVEQIESTPYDSAGLRVPEIFTNGCTYRVQYGRRLVFADTFDFTTTLRVPAREGANVILDALVTDVSTDTLTLQLDVGDDGMWDWQTTQAYDGPTTLSSPDLAAVFNAYWTAQGAPTSGDLDVPIRVSLNAPGQVLLTNLYAPPTLDLAVRASDVTFGVSPTVESKIVPVTVTLHNEGSANPGSFTVAFYAESEYPSIVSSQRYVGSAFVPGIAAGGTAQASFDWNTLGFTGTTALRVVVDPYSRLNEADKSNNEAVAELPILTRPDILVDEIVLSDDEPMVGETVTVTLVLHNAGQAAAGVNIATLDVETQNFASLPAPSIPGGQTTNLVVTWVPTATGQYRLFATGDREDTVNESDEGNNRMWRDVHVGLAGPLAFDAGSGSEPAYTPQLGFGVLDTGQPDVLGTCDAGDAPELTHRRDPSGQLAYRFDHLLPGHFYHLDVTLYECDRAGRQERMYIDNNLVAGPEDLGDGQVHRLSILVDPVLYADRNIHVTIESPDTDGAIVSHISLHDISYHYIDAGGPNDLPYISAAKDDIVGGWLDGVANTDWGTFSRQSVRVDQEDAELRYRFDHLDPGKRYRLHFTFYQPTGQIHIQRVKVDGMDVGLTVNTGDYAPHRETVRVPLLAYHTDGSLIVSILRLNALSGAMVNEIMLEEETLPTEALCQPAITPNFSEAFGTVKMNGEAAPPGTIIQAINPRGDTVGCFLVENDGHYGMMRIYGEDASVTPPVPGMRDSEIVAFQVDGSPAVPTSQLYWQDDKVPHKINLNAGGIEGQSILLRPGWNLLSFHYEPPVPLVGQTLDTIQGRFSHVLGENGVCVPSLSPVFQSLTELHTGEAYYTYITGTTSVNLLIEGTPPPATTSLTLHSGWNWVGYLPTNAQPVTTALQSIKGQYQRVLGLDKTFDPAYPDYSTLTALQPGEGYLIYMTQSGTLSYPAGTTQARQAIEQKNITISCAHVNPTPYLTLVYGRVTVNGEPAPVGTHVDIVTPQGDSAGCFIVDQVGRLALTHVYGADDNITPVVPGFVPGEKLSFRVNGLPVLQTAMRDEVWADDKAPRYVELYAAVQSLYLPRVIRE